jgi:menaquinone-dependent protoporphyrinogen oxidase
MNDQILITYATRAGSTAGIAAAIGENLGKKGFRVDVRPIKDKPALDGYQAVILGSAIRMGSWLPEAVKYIEDNQARLKSMPVVLFSVHMLNTGEDQTSCSNRRAYFDKVRPFLDNPEEICFQGVMDYAKLSFLDKLIAKMVNAEEADHRNWEKIRAWTPEPLR